MVTFAGGIDAGAFAAAGAGEGFGAGCIGARAARGGGGAEDTFAAAARLGAGGGGAVALTAGFGGGDVAFEEAEEFEGDVMFDVEGGVAATGAGMAPVVLEVMLAGICGEPGAISPAGVIGIGGSCR